MNEPNRSLAVVTGACCGTGDESRCCAAPCFDLAIAAVDLSMDRVPPGTLLADRHRRLAKPQAQSAAARAPVSAHGAAH